MTSPCIHGFRTEQCAACRSCPHGLVTSQCGRCMKASSTPALRKAAIATHGHHPPEEREGFEIAYVPALNGWQILREGEPTSSESYRSLFLARKAADQLTTEPTPAGSKRRG